MEDVEMDEFAAFLGTLRGDQVAFAGLVTFAIFALFKGWLVPGPTVRDRMEDKERQIAILVVERDDWKTAFHTSEEARKIINQQNSDLIRGAEATNRLLESLRLTVATHPGSTQGEVE